MVEIDEEAVKIAAEVITNIVEDIVKAASGGVRFAVRKTKLRLHAGFTKYAEFSLSRTSKIKTVVNPGEKVNVEDIYVPLSFTSPKKKRCSDVYVIDQLLSANKILITGTAGGGKSIFLKTVNTRLCKTSNNTLPIFYELRTLNLSETCSLMEAIYITVSEHIQSLALEDFNSAVRSGNFTLILDGFDEIDHDKRKKYADEINLLCENYPAVKIMISSRPEDMIESLIPFATFFVQPLRKSQVLQLLEKIDYDQEAKELFIREITRGLYNKHRGMLSIPLLVTMMLLTFSQFSDVPDKIHIFYQQAFEVLFQRHDRSKGGAYTRKFHTNLAIDVFQRVFSHFCASSYIADYSSFGETLIREFLSDSITYESLELDADDLLQDLVVSTCLLQRDGLEYTFVHRSFQEYFTAIFLSKLNGQELGYGLNSIITRQSTDSVVTMMADINRDAFERSWAKQTLKEIFDQTSNIDIEKNCAEYLKPLFTMFQIADHITIQLDHSKLLGIKIFIIVSVYRDHFSAINNAINKDKYARLIAEIQDNDEFRAAISKFIDVESLEPDFKDYTYRPIAIDSMPTKFFELVGLSKWLFDQNLLLNTLYEEIQQRSIARDANLTDIFNKKRYS